MNHIREIINELLENGIIASYSDGVYIMDNNADYSLMMYDATQRIEGKVVEIMDTGKDVFFIGDDISAKYNDFNILTMIDHKNNLVIDSKKICYHLQGSNLYRCLHPFYDEKLNRSKVRHVANIY